MLRKLIGAAKKYSWLYVPYDKSLKISYFFNGDLRKKINAMRREFQENYTALPKKNHGKKLCVVFICQCASIWTSFKSVYIAAKNDKDIDAYILALPEKIMHKNYDVHHEEYEPENKAYAMCREYGEKVIDAYDYASKKWFDLHSLEPDYVFIPRPYDSHLPPCYRSDELKKYTKVCYVAYGYTIAIWANKLIGIDFLGNCSFLFSESEYDCDIVSNVLNFLRVSETQAKFLGFPRFDLLEKNTYGGGGGQ